MNEQKHLNDCVAQQDCWRFAALELLAEERDLKSQAELYGQWLVGLVRNNYLEMDELRGGVHWANALDKEVVEVTNRGADLIGTDLLEATARRVAHHSGRWALKHVRNYRLRLIQQINPSKSPAAFTAAPQDM